jgi:hypothetical protein
VMSPKASAKASPHAPARCQLDLDATIKTHDAAPSASKAERTQ